jgi:uncharacterized protein (TIGR02118 family)
VQTAFFTRPADETPAEFGARLRVVAEKLAADDATDVVVLHVADDATGAPEAASSDQRPFDAALTVDGVTLEGLDDAAAVYEVGRRIVKERTRAAGGARTPGFTLVCPTVRKAGLTHEAFDTHWAEHHSRVHVASSPGTCHYEQHPVAAVLTRGAPPYDGFGRLSFATTEAFERDMFAGEEGQRAIYEDIERFLDPERTLFASWATSEYVYKDTVAT